MKMLRLAPIALFILLIAYKATLAQITSLAFPGPGVSMGCISTQTANFSVATNTTLSASATLRDTFAASLFSVSGTCTTSVTFSAGSGGLHIGAAYIGPLSGSQGSGNFNASSLTQLTFSGSGSATIAGNATLASDFVPLALNNSTPIIVTFYSSNSSDYFLYGTISNTYSGALTGVNQASSLTVSGYTVTGNSGTNLVGISKIQWN